MAGLESDESECERESNFTSSISVIFHCRFSTPSSSPLLAMELLRSWPASSTKQQRSMSMNGKTGEIQVKNLRVKIFALEKQWSGSLDRDFLKYFPVLEFHEFLYTFFSLSPTTSSRCQIKNSTVRGKLRASEDILSVKLNYKFSASPAKKLNSKLDFFDSVGLQWKLVTFNIEV